MTGRRCLRLCIRFLLAIAFLTGPGEGDALGAIDLNGRWDVTITVPSGSFPQSWFIAQAGSTLSQLGPYTGTIDTGTGVMSFGGTYFGAGCDSGGGPDSWTGTAAGDSNSFTASGTMYLPVNMTPPFFCAPMAASLTATRNSCGDGVIDPGEDCDDGDLLGSDCCSFNCTIQPDEHGCDDGNPGTPSVCLAGICTSLPPTPEFQVNSYATGRQLYHDIACDSDGDFIVVWRRTTSLLPQGGTTEDPGVYAQRYTSAGTPVGSEFLVTSEIFGQYAPAVAADADGDVVVTWKLANEVRARRYDSAGSVVGTEFVVTTDTGYVFSPPDIDATGGGDFVVTWSQISPGPLTQVFARRFDNAGTAVGPAFPIGATTTSAGTAPRVATDDAGNFVVVWHRSSTVFGQRFDASGTAVGTEFQVSPYPGFQALGGVASTPSGHFVVTLSNDSQDGSGLGIFAQRYSNTGASVGSAFQVNTYTTDSQFRPNVAIDGHGNFVIVWDSPQDGSSTGIYGQRFDGLGAPIDTEFAANGFTFSDQLLPQVCSASDGDFVVAWVSAEQDGSELGVFARLYDVPTPPHLVDHYKCYQGTDLQTPAFAQITVGTSDQLTAESVDVRRLKFVCMPVDKNGEGINDPGAHLSCYQVKGAKFDAQPVVELSSQFQTSRLALKKPSLLCLPSTKTVLP